MRKALQQHFAEHVIMASDNYPDVIHTLYALNDKKRYSIVSFSYVDEYSFFLIEADAVYPAQLIKEVSQRVKTEGSYQNSELQALFVNLSKTWVVLRELFADSTRTTRIASDEGDKGEVVLPPMVDMKRFYECERKTRYETIEEATDQLNFENSVYLCVHCGKLHQGKQPTGMSVPAHVMEGRYKTAYRRYHNI